MKKGTLKRKIKRWFKPKTIATGYDDHLAVGLFIVTLTAIALWFLNPSLKDYPWMMMVGMLIGSVWPDVDLKQSRASKVFYGLIIGAALAQISVLLMIIWIQQGWFWWQLAVTGCLLLILFIYLATKLIEKSVHRGITHGIFGILLGSMLIGFMLNIGYDHRPVDVFMGAFLGIIIHIAADFAGSYSFKGLFNFDLRGVLPLSFMVLVALILNDLSGFTYWLTY